MIRSLTAAGAVLLLLGGCQNDYRREHWNSGYICSCAQTDSVREFVARVKPTSSGGYSPADYVDVMYATAVRTTCDHRDSVLTYAYGSRTLGLKPCEMWYCDMTPIRP